MELIAAPSGRLLYYSKTVVMKQFLSRQLIQRLMTMACLLALAPVVSFKPLMSYNGAETWTPAASVNNVDFYYRLSPCDGTNTVMLRLHNRNAFNVRIAWEEAFTTKELKEEIQNNNGAKQVTLKKFGALESNCTQGSGLLVIRGKEISKTHEATITRYHFRNIKVERTN